ncbi:Ubiquinone/menaquinone biosynthesis C-methyltransferase UbiE [uncultured archaeon]|nr:Ubiquinone/menaquinone biosynthesis C-methyltransferase UbiE [uncultured archaeon]
MLHCACFDKFAWLYNPLMKLSGKPREYYRKIKSISNPKKSDSVLDVGGGTGLVAEYFVHDVKRVVVLDPSRKMLEKIKSDKIERVHGFAQNIEFAADTFDIVYCVDAMHHFTNSYKKEDWKKTIAQCIKEMLRVLKKGGTLVIIEFDTEKPVGRFIEFFENKIMRWGSCFWTREEFRELFKKYSVDVRISDLGSYTYVVKIIKKFK